MPAHVVMGIQVNHLQPSSEKKENVDKSFFVAGLHLHQYLISNVNKSARLLTFTSPSTSYDPPPRMIRFYDSIAVLGVHGKAIVDPSCPELLRQKYDLLISKNGVKDISRQRFSTNDLVNL